MTPDPDHTIYLIGAIVFGVGIFVILEVVKRMFVHSVPRDMARWRDAVERAAVACIQADLTAAETKGHLMELIGTIPADFNPSAFLGLQLAAGVQRAVLIEAERRGLVRDGMFATVYGMSVDQATVGSGTVPPPAPPADTVPAPAPPREPDVEFVEGKLVPRGTT